MKKYINYTILFIIVLSLASCIQYKEIEIVNITDVGIKEISIKGIEIEVAMQIKNPNKYDINIIGSDLTILLRDKKMATANIKEKIKLKKKSNSIYRFTIYSSMKDLTSGAIPVLMTLITKSSIQLRVKGEIKAKAKGISKKVSIDFKENVTL